MAKLSTTNKDLPGVAKFAYSLENIEYRMAPRHAYASAQMVSV